MHVSTSTCTCTYVLCVMIVLYNIRMYKYIMYVLEAGLIPWEVCNLVCGSTCS